MPMVGVAGEHGCKRQNHSKRSAVAGYASDGHDACHPNGKTSVNATANNTLEQIKAMLAMPDTSPSNITSRVNIVHRIRSSCSTIGAVALDAEFQELVTCENNIEAEKQYAMVVEVFKTTQEVLRSLLSDIKGA